MRMAKIGPSEELATVDEIVRIKELLSSASCNPDLTLVNGIPEDHYGAIIVCTYTGFAPDKVEEWDEEESV